MSSSPTLQSCMLPLAVGFVKNAEADIARSRYAPSMSRPGLVAVWKWHPSEVEGDEIPSEPKSQVQDKEKQETQEKKQEK